MCTLQKKKQCTKKSVRQIWIENMVLEYAIRLAQDDALLDYIAENTYQYCLAQHTDTSYTKSLKNALAETEKAIANLLRAIEAGIFNKSTKDRMNELEEQKAESKTALVAAKLKEDLGLKKENIEFFLHQFADLDYSDVACQKRLIKTFVNSVFVYDDKVVLTFNYSADRRTMTLKEIDSGLQQGFRIPRAVVHQKSRYSIGSICFFYCSLEIRKTLMQQSRGLLLARARPSDSSIFANGEKANESTVDHFRRQ